MNSIQLIGNLGVDPELFTTQNGFAITTLKMATTSKRKDGDNWVDTTQWHTVKLLGKQAEVAAKYLSKGSKVGIEGELQYRTAEKDGNKTYFTEILANKMHFLGSKADGSNNTQADFSKKPEDALPGAAAGSSAFDDIPF